MYVKIPRSIHSYAVEKMFDAQGSSSSTISSNSELENIGDMRRHTPPPWSSPRRADSHPTIAPPRIRSLYVLATMTIYEIMKKPVNVRGREAILPDLWMICFNQVFKFMWNTSIVVEGPEISFPWQIEKPWIDGCSIFTPLHTMQNIFSKTGRIPHRAIRDRDKSNIVNALVFVYNAPLVAFVR